MAPKLTSRPQPTASGTRRQPGALGAFGIFLGCTLAGFAAVALSVWPHGVRGQMGDADRLQALIATFARPTFVPHPPDNAPTPAKIALGKRLFEDPRLSSTGKLSCASCHDARLGFADGEPTGRGVTGRRLVRHTPTLWNSAFSPLLFWDGRAESLEEQMRFPLAHPDEMGSTLEQAVAYLSADASYGPDFAAAFAGNAQITPSSIAKALAAYERTLVSPPTRFDRWIAGDVQALGEPEKRGFALFTGKGRCSTCHSGFALTDHGFYDIGLPGNDQGRGAIIDLDAARHAFKTPTLREIAWSAPYMHDGSLATLDDVVRHYESGGITRSTLSRDMPKGLRLTDGERADLLAFLDTLSSERPPQPSREPWVLAAGGPPAPPPASGNVVRQADKTFLPAHVRIGKAEALTILNDDTRTHNIRIFDKRLDFNSGAQEPSQSVILRFPEAGSYDAFCGIHPSMRLRIDVK